MVYPNGKIYVGSDLTADALYIGSPSAVDQIARDLGIEPARFPRKPLAHQTIVTNTGTAFRIEIPEASLVLRKEILWESETATDTEVRSVEVQFIRELHANDPDVGYNKSPRFAAT